MTRVTFLAAIAAAACLAGQWIVHRQAREGYDRDVLPAYDAYAYVAMAEQPRYFTVAPWAYRILTPGLVRALPVDVVTGFGVVTLAGLLASAALLHAFLVRLGHPPVASAIAASAFVFLGPTVEVIEYPFLVEPMTLALEVAFLLALAGRGATGTLALIAVLGALSKELHLLLVPLVFFARVEADGARSALRKTAIVGAAALAATLLVRTWVPLTDVAALGRPPLAAVLQAWRRDWPDTWRGGLMLGLTPIALAGALLPRARPYLRRYGYGLAVTLVVPFTAFVNVGDPRVIFFGKNTERLLLYAIPFLVPLALHAIDALRGRGSAVADPVPNGTTLRRDLVAAALAAATLLAVGLGLDRYRRLDLRGTRDGPFLLAFCRESLASAHRLARGRFTSFDPGRDRFVAGESDARDLGRMRWYLRAGWGPRPWSISAAEVFTQEPRATLVLPCLEPADWQLTLWLSSSEPAWVRVDVNGRPVGEAHAMAQADRTVIAVPRDALFRGDNIVGLTAPRPGLRLHRFTVRPPSGSEPD
ncbi:MAG TPA: hypothetical protein VFQ51_16795 [Vicinamibacteria bacterium]|nr:hypothetical protein [Vicinamibacteria bacterium]